ncbi:hypothetical protein HAX54_025088 [Datura stramonium]|uniref:Ankyrin repeat domain-containing protein n=1 Tax=Datura stramonium TaxID=4076 RepID=A0ABS8UZ14_DATST|nr:hypothetical protein [Datura stramonium]
MSRPATTLPVMASSTTIKPEDYTHSPVHYAVILGDHSALNRLISSLPRLADQAQIQTRVRLAFSGTIADKSHCCAGRRDNPNRETPLHLAVRLNDVYATRTLAVAGADISLQNAAGWNALQEAIMRRCSDIVSILVQHHHLGAWSKVPPSTSPSPSDTYKIWKCDGNLRADTSLSGYDGLKVQRANQSFLFLGDGGRNSDIQLRFNLF